jgi:hypothetical protein
MESNYITWIESVSPGEGGYHLEQGKGIIWGYHMEKEYII